MSSDETEKPKKKSHRLKLVVALVLVLLIIFGVKIYLNLFRSPAEGTVSNPVAKTATKPAPLADKKYTGKYFAINYPGNYRVITKASQAGYLDSLNLLSYGQASAQATISIKRESLTDDAGYSYRLNHPEIYKQTSVSGSIIFTKLAPDEKEKTVFLSQGALVATISTSSSFSNTLDSLLSGLLKSFTWKQ